MGYFLNFSDRRYSLASARECHRPLPIPQPSSLRFRNVPERMYCKQQSATQADKTPTVGLEPMTTRLRALRSAD
jgi:hypothetical protein